MSLADLILDERKTWLAGRMEDLTIDNHLEIDGDIVLGPTGTAQVTMGFTGAAVLSADVILQKVANQVFMNINSTTVSGTTGTIISTSAIPERFWPTAASMFYANVVDNNTERQGSVEVSGQGIITVGVNLVSGGSLLPGKPFGTGTNGWREINGTYTI